MIKARSITIALILSLVIIGVTIYLLRSKNESPPQASNSSQGFTYYNLLHGIKFSLPDEYEAEDIAYPQGVALYKEISEEFARTKTESDFLKTGGVYIKTLRQITGTRESFDIFRKQDFETKLKQLNKTFTGEMFVTDQGYDAFKTVVTNPSPEVHIVVNAPIAYWFIAQSDTSDFQKIYQTFTSYKEDGEVTAKKAVNVTEEFIKKLQSGEFDQAQGKMSMVLKNKFTTNSLQTSFNPEKDRLSRQLWVFSIQTNGDRSIVHSTLENPKTNLYAFVNTDLIIEANEWKIDRFVFNQDSNGLPYENAIRNTRKEIKKESLLQNTK